MYIFQALGPNDQPLYDEYKTAYDLQEHLKTKYAVLDAAQATLYMNKLLNFQYTNKFTIMSAQDKLKEYRRKLSSANTVLALVYPDENLYMILSQALPGDYATTKDVL